MRQRTSWAAAGARLRTTDELRKGRALRRRGGTALLIALGLVATMAATTSTGAHAAPAKASNDRGAFRQVNLVSDLPKVAAIRDPAVKNPWGIAFGLGKNATPLWVDNQFNPASNCGSPTCIPAPADLLTKITLYQGANGVDRISKVPLEVTASSPTGMVFNPTSDFVINQAGQDTPALFMFNETFVNAAGNNAEGRITGWSPNPSPAPPPTTTTSTDARQDPGFPAGLALVRKHNGHPARLLVVDGITAHIHVYNTHFADVTKPGKFVDKDRAVRGLIAYNVMFLGGKVYVTYFNGPGQGGGAIGVFTRQGRFLKTLVHGAPLVGPWGMAISPKHWNGMGRSLIVGNVDDGTLHAFGLHNGRLRGTLKGANGKPLVIPGLWGIAFGNGVIGTPRSLIFAAGVGSVPGVFGPDVYQHGLVGLIEPLNRHDEVN